MKRTPMKRSAKPLKRRKRLTAGKRTTARRDAMRAAVDAYFAAHGYFNGMEFTARCQLTGIPMTKVEAVAHHKTPRSEMRKAGITDLDAPERLLVCHHSAHMVLHGRQMGRPKAGPQAELFARVEASPVNAATGGVVHLQTLRQP